MRVLFHPRTRDSFFVEGGVDALIITHELAAVAWDRDCADVELAFCSGDLQCAYPELVDTVLRVSEQYNNLGYWNAFTGPIGNLVAWWDSRHLRWVRT